MPSRAPAARRHLISLHAATAATAATLQPRIVACHATRDTAPRVMMMPIES
jgi:hypothetical protein